MSLIKKLADSPNSLRKLTNDLINTSPILEFRYYFLNGRDAIPCCGCGTDVSKHGARLVQTSDDSGYVLRAYCIPEVSDNMPSANYGCTLCELEKGVATSIDIYFTTVGPKKLFSIYARGDIEKPEVTPGQEAEDDA